MYNVLIIGCWPGGHAAGIRAVVQLGGMVAIVKAGGIGGTCINLECIFSKIWLRACGSQIFRPY